MSITYTANFRFGIPDFLTEPWHEDFAGLIQAIDRVIYQLAIAESVSFWANSTAFVISDLVIDSVTGIMYTCTSPHTSPAAPTTFAQDRVANPSRWNATANLPQQRGIWASGQTYVQGDFVIDTNRYAVCLVGHVSGVFNTDLAAGKWSVLVDLSSIGIGVNAEAEGSIAAASVTDIGAMSPTRLLVTGAATINDFGNVANKYKILRYQGVCTVTDSPIIDIPGSSNRVTDAGGVQFLSSDSTGKWRELFYTRGDGAPLGVADSSTTVKGIIETATVAEAQAGVDTSRAVTPAGLAAAIADATTAVLNTIRAGVGSTLDTLAEIATALNFLAPLANPVFTGNPTAPTVDTTNVSTTIATTSHVRQAVKHTTQILSTPGTPVYTTPTNCKRIVIRMVAAGGGGGGGNANNGTAGANSSFGSWTCVGGGLGTGAAGGNVGAGGDSGSDGAGTRIRRVKGGHGGQATFSSGGSGWQGGAGGGTPFSTQSGVGGAGQAGVPGALNSGGGGGGGSAGTNAGSGGGGGEYVEFYIDNPDASYSCAVGTKGSGGAAGGSPGGNGGDGMIIIDEYY